MKRKRKKRRKEKKRREKLLPRFELGQRAKALPLDNVEHTHSVLEFLLLKPSSLIKYEFKDIFQKK